MGDHFYDELAKCMFMVVVEDEQVEAVTNPIQEAASTGFRAMAGCSLPTWRLHTPSEQESPACKQLAAR